MKDKKFKLHKQQETIDYDGITRQDYHLALDDQSTSPDPLPHLSLYQLTLSDNKDHYASIGHMRAFLYGTLGKKAPILAPLGSLQKTRQPALSPSGKELLSNSGNRRRDGHCTLCVIDTITQPEASLPGEPCPIISLLNLTLTDIIPTCDVVIANPLPVLSDALPSYDLEQIAQLRQAFYEAGFSALSLDNPTMGAQSGAITMPLHYSAAELDDLVRFESSGILLNNLHRLVQGSFECESGGSEKLTEPNLNRMITYAQITNRPAYEALCADYTQSKLTQAILCKHKDLFLLPFTMG